MSSAGFDLARLQRWMLDGLIDPDTLTDEAVEAEILPGHSLTARERFGVYGGMYYLRLVGILETDFEGVRYAMGDPAFRREARAFLARHPSRYFSLNRLGAGFPEWLAHEARELADRGFISDLARLEWAWQEVFDAPAAEPMDVEALAAIPTDRWGEARLHTVPCMRLLAVSWPVNAWLKDFRECKEPPIPGPEAEARNHVLMYRRDYRVWRTGLSKEQFAVLGALHAGRTLGEAIQAAADLPDADEEHVGQGIRTWFRRWTAEGLFQAAELD